MSIPKTQVRWTSTPVSAIVHYYHFQNWGFSYNYPFFALIKHPSERAGRSSSKYTRLNLAGSSLCHLSQGFQRAFGIFICDKQAESNPNNKNKYRSFHVFFPASQHSVFLVMSLKPTMLLNMEFARTNQIVFLLCLTIHISSGRACTPPA